MNLTVKALLLNLLVYKYSVADFLSIWSQHKGVLSGPNYRDQNRNSRWAVEVVDFLERYKVRDG